ncbi:MAG: hypothetical protein ABIF10_02540 [Candidatus Woesearchaeota archaeon]
MDIETLKRIEGLQTADTVAEKLDMTRQSAINLVSKLKKEGYATTSGGPRVHIYRITLTKQLPRSPGMFDIINRYSPHMKLNPWYDHQVHGKYGPEEALIDAIQTKSFRAILASLRLYQHITDWKLIYKLAKEKDSWQQVGALYDLAKMHFRVRRIPKKYENLSGKQGKEILKQYKWIKLTMLGDRGNFPTIQEKWCVYIPFNKNDLREII